MARNVYEAMFIFDSTRYSRDPDGATGELAELIKKAGGEILVSRLWEERRLAFTIKGQRKGIYWLMYVRMDPLQVAALRRQLEITESILRFLLLKIDPRIVEALVAHAQSVPLPSVVAAEEAPAAVVAAVAAVAVEVEEEVDEEVAE